MTLISPARAASSVSRRPSLRGLARLMTMAFEGVDLAPLAASLIECASADPDDADALMDLSTILQLQGVHDLGVTTQAHALAGSACTSSAATARRRCACWRSWRRAIS